MSTTATIRNRYPRPDRQPGVRPPRSLRCRLLSEEGGTVPEPMKSSTALPARQALRDWRLGRGQGSGRQPTSTTRPPTKDEENVDAAAGPPGGLAAANGKIYVSGGFVAPENLRSRSAPHGKPSTTCGSTIRLPIVESLRAAAGKRGAAVAVEVGGKIFVIGGVTTVEAPRNRFHVLWAEPDSQHQRCVDPATNKWESRRPMACRAPRGCWRRHRKIYVIGGRTATASSCPPPTRTWWRSTIP